MSKHTVRVTVAVVVAVVASACAAPPAEDEAETGGQAISQAAGNSQGIHEFAKGTPGVSKSCGMSPEQLETGSACILPGLWCRARQPGASGAPCQCETPSGWKTGGKLMNGDAACKLDEQWPRHTPGTLCVTPYFWCTEANPLMGMQHGACRCTKDGELVVGHLE
jgi:hypothetical protein